MYHRLGHYYRLTRPRILGMVLLSVVATAIVAAESIPPPRVLLHAIVGNGLVIVGALILNQRLEWKSDARMGRTRLRPLPDGSVAPAEATLLGAAATAVGCVYLLLLVGTAALALAAASWCLYVWLYTPLKPLSPWQTPLGAVAGAMPTLLGAAAVDRLATPAAAAMFLVLYFWQFPHAMAIGWLYRGDFRRAGVRLLTVVEPSGRAAGRLAMAGAAALTAASLWPHLAGGLWPRPWWTAILGAMYLAASVEFALRPDDRRARRLLHASILYLVLFFAGLLATVYSG